MQRLLATYIFAYAGLSAAQWDHAARWLYAPPHGMWCGNVVSDPFMFLVNVVAPLAALSTIVLVYQCVKSRCWSLYGITAVHMFVVTSACLAYEGYYLGSEYGVPLGHVWWLPWV